MADFRDLYTRYGNTPIRQPSTISPENSAFEIDPVTGKQRFKPGVEQSLSDRIAASHAENPIPEPNEQAMADRPPLDTMKPTEVTETVSTGGLTPTPESTGVGGVRNTVDDTQAAVNKILGPKRPSDKRLRDAVDAYDAAARNLKEQSVDTTELDQKLADARAAYREKADRNEMLSLVQMIAQSFAKLGAYQYGAREGRYNADQVNVPGVDYEKRSDRALREYAMDVAADRSARANEMAKADKRYQLAKDQLAGLRERVGAEESALGRETQMYGAELSASEARARDERAAARAKAGETNAEERFNRQFGAKDYDNAQQEEAVLSRKETAINELAQAMSADTKESRKKIPDLAAKAGVSTEELDTIKQNTQDKGIIWDSENPQAAANALTAALLPGVRGQLDALMQRKAIANEMMRTGSSMEDAQRSLGNSTASPTTTEKKPTPEQVAKYRSMYPNVTDEQATQILTDRLNGRGR